MLFLKLSNQESQETKHSKKKKKFKAITKAPSSKDCLVGKLNLTIDNTENDLIASKYFELNYISSLFNKKLQFITFLFKNVFPPLPL